MRMLNVSAEVQKYFPISEINSFEGHAIVLVSQNTCSFMYVAKLGGPGVKSDGRVPTGQWPVLNKLKESIEFLRISIY